MTLDPQTQTEIEDTLRQVRKHPDALCEECPLFENKGFCPSDGPDEADLVLIGEAPGQREVVDGKPFTGASGQLLNRVLGHYGIERNEIFVTNTILCRPKGNANPPAAAIKACKPRLLNEVQARRPKVIIPLGNFATRSVLSTEQGITQARIGRSKVSSDYPGVQVVPTFHPAASLYNPGSFPDIVTDFGKVKDILTGASNVSTSWTAPEITVLDDIILAKRFLGELVSGGPRPLALDVEIGVDKDEDFGRPDKYNLLCIGISTDSGRATVIGEAACNDTGVQYHLGRVLESQQLICHNGKFDIGALWEIGHGRLWFDTMLASYVLDERRGTNSLEYNAIELLGSPSWKHVTSHYVDPKTKNYSAIPRNVLYKYNGYDVANTFRLYEYFSSKLAERGLRDLHDFLIEVSDVLMHVERNGIAVNQEYLDTLTYEYQLSMDTLRQGLRDMIGVSDYNPNSWQQVGEALKGYFKVPSRRVPNTQKGTLLDLQEWAALQRKMDLYEFLAMHLEFKSEAKSYGTYVKGTRKRLYRGRVHSTFLIHGTVTGRLSSRNPNLQNVTRGSRLRRLFVPGSDTNVLGQADYRQAEFRVICALAREPYLRDIFLTDRNIHEEVGKQFYGPGFTKADKERYIRAKAVVFGLSYGREAYSLAAEYKMPVSEAQRYINQFFELIPNVAEWRKEVISQVKAGQDMINPFGRRRRFWLITKENRNNVYKEAYAFLPQSTASDLTLAAGVTLAKKYGLQDNLRIPVHDAWVFECEKGQEEGMSELFKKVMAETAVERFTDYVPFDVDVEFGPSWGDIS